MKTVNKLVFTMAIAISISACTNNEKSKTTKTVNKTPKTSKAKTVDINTAMEGMPRFSTPEIQISAEGWFTAFSDGMKEAQQKAILANGDQAKVKEIASEMSNKFAPWKQKIETMKAEMTAEDKKLFDDYGAKIATNLVAQAQKNN